MASINLFAHAGLCMLLDDETRCSLHWKDSWHMCLQVHMHALPGSAGLDPVYIGALGAEAPA